MGNVALGSGSYFGGSFIGPCDWQAVQEVEEMVGSIKLLFGVNVFVLCLGVSFLQLSADVRLVVFHLHHVGSWFQVVINSLSATRTSFIDHGGSPIKFIVSIALLLVACGWANVNAQHHMPDVKTHSDTTRAIDTNHVAERSDSVVHVGGHATRFSMMSALVPFAPANREGSGTSWLPDNSPMSGLHATAVGWQLMAHGNAWIGYTQQNAGGDNYRRGDQFNSRNWVMLMAHRMPTSKFSLLVRTMLSADRLTMGGSGYSLLMQSGETWLGQPLVDRQHPHDLFAELALAASYQFANYASLFGYFGFPGEPAFGPPVFMHRPSAVNLPDAPLGHHWQDATHITFGVATLGISWQYVQLEGSLFTGREPDENRYGFDRGRFDSHSARLSAVPTKATAVQVSWAYVKSPESLEPEVDQRKTSVSVLFNPLISQTTTISSALVWSMNDPSTEETSHAVLAESNIDFGPHSIFGRVEWVEKSTHDLGLEDAYGERTLNTYGVTVGLAHRVLTWKWANLRVGGQVSLNPSVTELKPFYGSNPVSFQLFVRISPLPMGMAGQSVGLETKGH